MYSIFFNKMTYIYATFTIVSVVITIITMSFLNLMLGFNIFLAYIPVILIKLLGFYMKEFNYKFNIKSIGLLILFILFLPNTFYVITDLIHLDASEFMFSAGAYSPTIYLKDYVEYLTLFHVAFTLLFGVYAGVVCLDIFSNILQEMNYKKWLTNLVFFLLVFSSSIAIFIGRFLRFFSWEIFDVTGILSSLFSELNWFMIFFVGGFVLIHYSLKYLYDLALSKE